MYSWEFDTKKQKSATWYTIALTLSIALIIWGFFTGLYMMSMVIFIAIWVYILIENNSPDRLTIEISENGILIWDIFYDYPKIETFSILYNRNIPVFLRLKLKWKGFRILDIPLSGVSDISDIRVFLLQYMEEDPNQEFTNMDRIISYLKL